MRLVRIRLTAPDRELVITNVGEILNTPICWQKLPKVPGRVECIAGKAEFVVTVPFRRKLNHAFTDENNPPHCRLAIP